MNHAAPLSGIRPVLGGVIGVVCVVVVGWCCGLPHADQILLWRTVWLGGGAALIAIPIAIFTAVCVDLRTVLGRSLLLMLIGLAVVPPYVNVGCWDSAFGKLGWLTSAKGQILQPLLSGWSAAIWIHAVGFVPPFAVLFFLAMYSGRSFEEQARMDLRPGVVFFHITLRRMLPLMLVCGLWSLIVCSREIAVTDLYQIGTLAEQVYLGYSLGQVNALTTNWSASDIDAAGEVRGSVRVVQLLVVVTLAAVFFGGVTRFSNDSSSTLGGDAAAPERHRWLKMVGGVCVILLLVAAPIGNLIFQSATAVTLVDGHPVQEWAVENLSRSIVKAAWDFRNAFFWSSLIAISSAWLIVVAALVICFTAKTHRKAWVGMVGATAVCAGLSGPDIGSGLTGFFSLSNDSFLLWFYDYTIGPAVIANVIFCWPLVTLIVWFAIGQTTEDQIENANLDRVGMVHRIYEFGFRQHWRTFVGVWMVAVAICFSELSASQMVLPPGIETVAQVTLGKLHAGVDETTAALSLLTIGLVVAIALSAWIIIRQAVGHQRPSAS